MNDLSSNLEEPVEFASGHVIFAEGEASKYLYIVLKGEARIFKETKNRLVPISIVKEKGFIGELSMFSDELRSATAIATKHSKLMLIKKSDIRKILKECPDWVTNIMVTISDRLRGSIEILREHNISGDGEGVDELTSEDLAFYLKNIKDYRSRRGL